MTCPTCGQPLPVPRDDCADPACGHPRRSHDIARKRMPCERWGPGGICKCHGYQPPEEAGEAGKE